MPVPTICPCGGEISRRSMCCNRCRIPLNRLMEIQNRFKNRDIRFTEQMKRDWIEKGIAPRRTDMKILPVEMFEWL